MGNSFYAYNDSMNYEVESGMDYSKAQMNEFAADYYGKNSYGCGSNYSKCPPCPPPPSNSACDDNVQLVGNSVNFSVHKDDGEIKADVIVGYRNSVRVWGQVKDCAGKVVSCAYVKLAKVAPNGALIGIAHTITDCLGFYQFDICPSTDGCDFTVIVGKAATSPERNITSGFNGLNCSPANGNNPCEDTCASRPNPCH